MSRNTLYRNLLGELLPGVPAAKQVAERFHLIQNLSKAVQDELAHQRYRLLIPAQEFVRNNTGSAAATRGSNQPRRPRDVCINTLQATDFPSSSS